MTVWLDRAGSYGEQEAIALEQGLAVVGWDDLPDLGPTESREDIQKLCEETYPDDKPKTIINWVGQLYAFRHRWKKGDYVILPLKTKSAIAIGKVAGEYKFHPDFPLGAKHSIPVRWLATDIPRTAFDQDLLYSFGAFMTVCKIQRNNAEERIQAVLEGKKQLIEKVNFDGEEIPNLAEYARDQIRSHISQKFKGHNLERLVNEILKAQGYQTEQVPAGPDGGIDVIAGRGPMGFDSPRLCVQVKSSDSPIDVNVLRELQGVLKKFGADQGLLISWGGFKGTVDKEARQIFFEIRLWDSDDLLSALFNNYENLSEDIQAELPLKRIWTLVLPEE